MARMTRGAGALAGEPAFGRAFFRRSQDWRPHRAAQPQPNMGRTPSSAADPLVRLFPRLTPTRGSAAGQGARPTKSLHSAKASESSSTTGSCNGNAD